MLTNDQYQLIDADTNEVLFKSCDLGFLARMVDRASAFRCVWLEDDKLRKNFFTPTHVEALRRIGLTVEQFEKLSTVAFA